MKHINKFSVLSNFFYFAPIYFSFLLGMYVTALLFILLFVSSTLFHIYKNRFWSVIDSGISYIVILQSLFLLATSSFSYLNSMALMVVISCALFIRYREEDKTRDDFWHGLWHIAVSIALIMIVLLHGVI
ncbi:MAG: hypothetical protein K9M11_03915 [Candidatus Pacebacteria bacterium]|nr:hypothetical protein [Candidatus Paceibacterota bacterium]